jgi:spoIIIJ-associated protein
MAGEQERFDARVEGQGATVGEAKWAAIKTLERRFPGVAADHIDFELLDQGDEGDGRPARVGAQVDLARWREAIETLPDDPAERVRALVVRVVQAFELRASVDIEETEEEIRATVNGEDLGLLIGKHGSTIDAVQHLAARAAYRGLGDRKSVVIDAAGYRERREAMLRRTADRAVEDALSFGRPVELEPMGPFERRTVHMYLRDRNDVQTHSEGDEPDRRLVVTPLRQRST